MPKIDQGVSLDKYQIIPRVLIFILKENKVLLLRGNANKRIWPGKYNGIGGHIERGEDAISAARRELHEESGLICDSLILCGTVFIDTGQSPGIGLFIYKGYYHGGKITSSQEGELEWIEVNEIGKFPIVEDLKQLIPLVFQWKPGTKPISGRYFYNNIDELVMEFSN
jgi:8-oxo-dGTP diphosphatase